MGRLSGRIALITGAAKGQGEAVARLFCHEGSKVVLADILDERGKTLARELGSNALYTSLDVSSESDWHAAVNLTKQRFGRLDILVNNAGILKVSPILEMDLDTYMEVIHINQVGCFLGMKIAGAAIVEAGGGSIVNTSSTAGLWGTPFSVAYVASKFAIAGMTKTAALELGPRGVRVNSVHPGVIDTDMAHGFEGVDPEDASNSLPVGRIGKPEEIAKLVLFLASDESSFCTGSAFTADGGEMAGKHFA